MSKIRFIKFALCCSAAPALICSGVAQAQTTAAGQARVLQPEWGTIRTFEGGVAPSWGTIRTFEGEVAPSWGTIRTFNGELSPYWGTIRTFWGTIRTFEGEASPLWGTIRTFEGKEISPFWGTIRTFWDNASPFEGNTAPFWGSLQTFNVGTANAAKPQWGTIRTFWDEVGQSWGSLRPVWDGGDYQATAAQLRSIADRSATVWGSAVTARTGKSFQEGFADPLLRRYGIDLNDPSTLAGMHVNQRETFFLEWYDGLMQFSGADSPDHWMNAVNWTPRLTQVQGSGADAVIGLIDFSATTDPDVAPKIIYSGGYPNQSVSHGAAVLSLIAGSHDGKGVMGIAPRAKVAAYNPFDGTGTASWDDVRSGIVAVAGKGASVVNLSLGVPGHPLHGDWRGVFKASEVDMFKDKALYVIAAGNSGATQAADINMKDAFSSTFILVGSVDPGGRISDFSNRPGTACLTDGDICKNTQVWNGRDKFEKTDYLKESGLLLNRFIVAPGELLLVSDGVGGVTRMSGTSFAAPLVSGAITLIHDRWPWLKNYPRDVAKIVLESAKDLGAPGPDPVYGMGLLDVEAAQSPLDFAKLKYYVNAGSLKAEVKADFLQQGGVKPIWEAAGMYLTAFEKIDGAERDFLVPLSSRLVGSMRNGEYFQDYLYDRLTAWMGVSSSLVQGKAPHGLGFSDLSTASAAERPGAWSMSFSGRLRGYAANSGGPRLSSAVQLVSPSGSFAMSAGTGDGAVFLGGTQALQMSSDFDPYSGGVNPLLGFASGGAHLGTRVELAPRLQLSGGFTQKRQHVLDGGLQEAGGDDRMLLQRIKPYEASAAHVRLDYRPTSWLGLNASLTQLHEENALLGVQSLASDDFAGGTRTNGLTLGAEAALGSGLGLFASATMSRSGSGDRDAALRVGSLTGTAFQVGISKDGVLGSEDRLRLSLAQPLTVERGSISMESVQVIDRETGEKGVVTQTFDIAAPGRRRFVAEAIYGAPVLDGTGSVSLFARGELRGVDTDTPRAMAGVQARLAF